MSTKTQEKRRKVTMERRYRATLDEVWELWTTKDGLESWWGPEGFRVEVRSLDLRPGGDLRYAMIAARAQEIAFMKQAGMPLTTEHRVQYTEVVPLRRLAYESQADFIPGVTPYGIETSVELHAEPSGVRMVLTFDAMHDAVWTERAVAGHESELRKLEALLDH